MGDQERAGNVGVSRRAMLDASGIAAVGVLGIVSAGAASAQTAPRATASQTTGKNWFRFRVAGRPLLTVPPAASEPSAEHTISPGIDLCAFDHANLNRGLATEDTIVLFFESHRSVATIVLECEAGTDVTGLLSQILAGALLDVTTPATHGIKIIRISDYIEWETMLPPRRPNT